LSSGSSYPAAEGRATAIQRVHQRAKVVLCGNPGGAVASPHRYVSPCAGTVADEDIQVRAQKLPQACTLLEVLVLPAFKQRQIRPFPHCAKRADPGSNHAMRKGSRFGGWIAQQP
jgi:hypothetical protein